MIRLELVRVVRRLVAAPRFSIAVIASIGLAVCPILVASAVFDAIFLRDLAVRPGLQEQILVRAAIVSRGITIPRGVSFPDYRDMRESLSADTSLKVAAWTVIDATRTGSDGEGPLRLAAVTGDYFALANVRFIEGRAPDDGEIGIVVRRALWQRLQSDGDPAAVSIHGGRYPIIGVVEDGFRGLYPDEGVEAWVPLSALPTIDGDLQLLSYREFENLLVLVAGTDGVAAPSLLPRVDVISARLVDFHERNLGWHLQATAAKPTFRAVLGTARGQGAFAALLVLLCVLFIAASNIGNLFVIRTTARQGESQIRLVLGLSRSRLILFECFEPLLLGAAGLALGLWWGSLALHALSRLPEVERMGLVISPLSLLAGCVAALLVVGFCALLPAITLARSREAEIVHAGQGITSRGASRAQRVYLTIQFTLALGFTFVAVMLASAVQKQVRVQVGFDTNDLLVVRGAQGADERSASDYTNDYERVVAAVSSLPGVESASGSISDFFGGYRPPWRALTLLPVGTPREGEAIDANMHVVGERFFATLGLAMRAGREFEPGSPGTSRTILVNETFGRMLAGDGQVVGKTIYEAGQYPLEIVGVVPDIRTTAAETVEPAYYRSLRQSPLPTFLLHVRVTAATPALASAIRAAIQREMPRSTGRLQMQTAEELRRQRDMPAIAMFWLSVGLALLTMVIAGLGLYSLASYAVATRTREFGIRTALGASPRELAALVIREGLQWTATAMALSLPAIWVGARLVRAYIVGAEPVPLLATAVVAGAYIIVVIIALAVPAIRITALSPSEALRSL